MPVRIAAVSDSLRTTMRGWTREAPAEMVKRRQLRRELRMLPIPPTLELQVNTREGFQGVEAEVVDGLGV